MQKEDNFKDLDITDVVNNLSIDRLFLLTNQNREESINFKNWIAEKLNIEVKAVTLEKGSEKYILNKIESIIKYILLAEEGHARFNYLPGENTLQINLWEIVNKNIYKGKIIYPSDFQSSSDVEEKSEKNIPVYNDLKEKKIFTVKAPKVQPEKSPLEKGTKAVKSNSNLLIYGEEGSGKKTLAHKILEESGNGFFEINFRTINPAKIETELEKIVEEIIEKNHQIFLLLNIEVLPSYIQERLTDFDNIMIISTLNINESFSLNDLNRKFYYMVSSTMITVNPLRSRKGNLPIFVKEIIENNRSQAVISDNALQFLQNHNWPGNFNELNSVISRACNETNSVITLKIIENSIDKIENVLDQWQNSPIDDNFKLNDVLGDVAMHYIMLALELAEGKKSKAARMLGFSNYQTLSNWIKKYKK